MDTGTIVRDVLIAAVVIALFNAFSPQGRLVIRSLIVVAACGVALYFLVPMAALTMMAFFNMLFGS